MALMIVESPSKAKTIEKYFSREKKIKIMASFGHVRDLPSKQSAIDIKNNFDMHYRIPDKSLAHVQKLSASATKHSVIYLATDPDREGEAIAWHISEILKSKNAINDSTVVKRVVFNEITKEATNRALENCRDIDMNLVNSQQARRAIDHLFGLSVSKLLWTVLPGSKSAGRVQSVALRLVCDREVEILNFKTQEYWSISAIFSTWGDKIKFMMTYYSGKKLEKFDIQNEERAQEIEDSAKKAEYILSDIKTKKVRRKPYAPFITSTLQQEASNNLRFSPKKTMMIAQTLYEGVSIATGETIGLITYMRTDGFYLSKEFCNKAASQIRTMFGDKYIPDKQRVYSSSVKNSQEAHEAIRPTDPSRTPESMKNSLTKEQFALYEIIWKRALASQAADAEFEQITVTVESKNKESGITFSASASKQIFDGFYRIYGKTEKPEEGQKFSEDQFSQGSDCTILSTNKHQHFTQPPPRYGEASLIKKMEEIGIGRPSTYASIISIIQERNYAAIDKNKNLAPSLRGQVVTLFLKNFLNRYIEYSFTNEMEEQLDSISTGNFEWKDLIGNFWKPLEEILKNISNTEKKIILKSIDEDFFSLMPINVNKKCEKCQDGIMTLSAGAKSGIFLGCSNYPDCKYAKELYEDSDEDSENGKKYPMKVGTFEGEDIMLKHGPYGDYIQFKNHRTSLPATFDRSLLSDQNILEKLIKMPVILFQHPETGSDIKIGVNKIGVFAYMDGSYYTIKTSISEIDKLDPSEILQIIENNKSKKEKPKLLGKNSKGKEVYLCNGRYGKYVKVNKKNISIKGKNEDDITLEEAIKLLENK